MTMVPAYAEDDSTLAEGKTTTVALPEGGEADFTPSEPSTDGASVNAATLDVSGATAKTPDGTVVAIDTGVELVATSSTGEDISEFEHGVTIVEATEDTPGYVSEFTPAIELTFPVSKEKLEGLDLASLGVWARESADDEWTWVPSAYDPELGAVVAQSDHLSEFAVMGAPAADPDPSLPRIALDPDDAVGKAVWNGNIYNELDFSYGVAELVKQELELMCGAEVLITRDDSDPYVSRTTRANRIKNFDADLALTMAFNTYNTPPGGGPAEPWGVEHDGGVVTYAQAGDSGDRRFAGRFNNTIPRQTGRSPERGPLTDHSLLPYSQFDNVAKDYAHVEMLFLDHNYDWPVIKKHLQWVANGVLEGIYKQIDGMSGISCVEPIVLPEPPTQAQIDKVRQLGKNNYQQYGTDPVNLATGNYLASEDVFSLTGVGDQEIDLTLAYNALDGRASPVGNGWNFGYSSRAQLYDNGAVMVILADGRSVFFEDDGAGGFTNPPGARTKLAPIDGGAILSFPDSTTLEFSFDEETGYGTMARAVDRQGNAYELEYGPLADADEDEVVFPPLRSITDEAGQVVEVSSTADGLITGFTHPDGRVWALGHDDAGNLTSITDGAGRTRSFAYNDDGLLEVGTGADGVAELTNVFDDEDRVIRQTDGAGYVREIEYGENRATTLTDALGNDTTLLHNDKNLVVEAVAADGAVTRTGYDESYNPTTSTDALGNVYTTEYDSYGRVTSYTDPLGATTTYDYNGKGDVVAMTQPTPNGGSATTTFVRNSDGRAIETHLPDGSVTFATFDDHGDVLSTTNAEGDTTSFAYDARGNQRRVTDAEGNVTERTFDLANRRTSETDPAGGTTTFAFDDADNLVRVTNPIGGVAEMTYDANDSMVSLTDEKGRTTTYEYNVNLQLTAIDRPDGTRVEYEYDAEHRLVAEVNADGTRRTWERDALGRPTALIDEAGERWQTEYDLLDNVVAVVEPNGARTEHEFDALSRRTGTTDALGGTSTVEYNFAGLVDRTTDELGRTVEYTYDDLGRLTSATLPDGSVNKFGYDDAGRVVSLTDRLGRTEKITLDGLGRTVRIKDALGGRWLTEYDSRGNAVAAENPLGQRTEMEFDALSRQVSITNAIGGVTRFEYDPVGNVVTATDPLGNATHYGYDERDRVTSRTYADGSVELVEYDARGNVAATTDTRGEGTSFVRDARGLAVEMIDEAGASWLTEYDSVGNVTAEVDPPGGRVVTEYDALARPVAVVDEVGARSETTYDAAGQVLARTNALGDVTSYEYDPMGRVLNTVSPQGAVTSYGYDAQGNLTNALGDTIAYEHDALDRLVSTTYPDEGEVTFRMDAVGQVLAKTDERGNETTYAFDALGRQVSMVDAAGFATDYAYDAIGNVTSITDARGGTQTFAYDALGRVTTEVNAEGEATSYEYDRSGNVVRKVDPAGIANRYAYDARGLLTETVENAVDGAPSSASVNVTTSVRYDEVGRVVANVDPRGNATTIVRDAAGRITAETDALGQTTQVELDALGRPDTVTSPDGSRVSTAFSPDGFVTEVAYPDRTVAFTHDALGNQLTMTEPLGTSTWEYDWAARTTRSVDALGQENLYEFDLAGNEVRVKYADGRVIERAFDARNRAVSQSDANGVTSFAYDEAADLVGIVRPSGVETAIERDLEGRATGIVHTGEGVQGNPLPSGEVNPSSMAPGNAFGHCKDNGNGHPNQQPAGCSTGALAFDYEYDDRGLVEERQMSTDAATTLTEYAHDELGRLTQSSTGDYVATYGWDAASNLVSENVADDLSTSKPGDGYAVTRQVNAANQLIEQVRDPLAAPASHTETTVFGYDGRGNRVSELTTTTSGKKTHTVSAVTYEYDGQDMLTSVSGGQADASYVRDGRGRALEVREDGATRTRLYDDFAVVRDGGTSLTRSDDGSVLFESSAVVSGNGKKATTTVQTVDVLGDVLGSAVATADGGVISADLALYGDFGDLMTEPSTDTVTGFTGQVDTAGLVEFATRSYDVDARVWLQDDSWRGSALRASSQNRYAYVEGAPETYVDVMGYFRAAAAAYAKQLAAFEAAIAEYERMVAEYEAEVADYEQRMADYDRRVAENEKAKKEYERAQKLYMIEMQWQSEQLGIQAEFDSLLFYHTVNGVGEAFKDPSFVVHTVLDVVGVVPVLGEVADGLNAAIYAAEGDYVSAGLSLAAMVPVAGVAATGAKIVKNAVKNSATAAKIIAKGADVATTVVKAPIKAVTKALDAVPTVKLPKVTKPKMPDGAPKPPAKAAEPAPTRGGRGPVDQGNAGVEHVAREVEANGGRVLGREITVDVQVDGTTVRTRADLLVEDACGERCFIEVKTGVDADLTPNQTVAYPEIRASGGTPMGGNALASGLTPGVPIGPTPVIERYLPWPLPLPLATP